MGYTLSAGKLDALTAGDNSNPLFLLVISAILGAVLGYLMGAETSTWWDGYFSATQLLTPLIRDCRSGSHGLVGTSFARLRS